jgi:aspartate kinase
MLNAVSAVVKCLLWISQQSLQHFEFQHVIHIQVRPSHTSPAITLLMTSHEHSRTLNHEMTRATKRRTLGSAKPMLVAKFGGDCMSNDVMEQTARLILDLKKSYRVCVVVSARAEVTDRLVQLATDLTPQPNPRENDALLSTGEMEAAALLAIKLISLNCPAKSFNAYQLRLRTDSAHGKARVLGLAPTTLNNIRQSDAVHVITGFQGITEEDDLSTFGRGGSDTTAVCIASALNADKCILFKKHLGIYDTDPAYDDAAILINELHADELVQMASLGMKAVQIRAAQFAYLNKVPLFVSSVEKPDITTAIIHTNSRDETSSLYKLVVARDKVLIAISGVKNRPGAFASIYSALIRESVYVCAVSQSHFSPDNSSLDILCGKEDESRVNRVAELLTKRKLIEAISHHSDVMVFSLIGRRMTASPGVLSKFLDVFSKLHIAIRLVNTSQARITVVSSEHITAEGCQKILNELRQCSLLKR